MCYNIQQNNISMSSKLKITYQVPITINYYYYTIDIISVLNVEAYYSCIILIKKLLPE